MVLTRVVLILVTVVAMDAAEVWIHTSGAWRYLYFIDLKSNIEDRGSRIEGQAGFYAGAKAAA